MEKFKKFEFAKNVLSTMFNQLKFLKMKKVTLLVIAVLFSLSLSACMKLELPQEKTTTEKGSNKDTNGKTDKTEDQPAKPDPEEEQYGTGVLLTPQEDYVKIPLASMPVLGDQTLPESYMLPIPDWTGSIDQGVFGTCLAQSTVMALTVEVSNKKRKIPYEQRDLAYFSPAFLYSLGRLPGNCASAGMTVDGVMEVVKTYGVCPIKYMPYNKQVCPSARPSAEAYKIASKTKIRGYQRAPLEEEKLKQLVYSGKPIILIVEANNAFKKAFFKGNVWRRGGGETPKGNNLHAILLTGYTPNALIALNSWGPGASGRGIISISPEMLGDFVLQAYVIETYQSYPPLTDDNEDQEDDTPKPEPQTIQVDQSELKFETTTIGQKTAKVLQITMTSGEDTNVSIQLSDEVNFQTLSKVYLYKSRQTASIGVTYRPESAGTHRAKLLLTSPNGFNKEVSLLGQAKQPEPEHDDIVIDNQSIDFGSIQLQQGTSVTTKQKSFRVTNNNQADVTLTLSSNTDAYTVSPEKVTISPRNTQTITVRLNVRGEGYYPGSIRVQSTRGYEERVQLSAQVVEQQRNDDRGDDRDRDNDRGDNHQDQNDQDHRQQPRYRVEVVPVSNVKKGDCIGLNKETLSGKITGKDSTVEETANGELILNIKLKKVDGGRYLRNGKFFIKYESFCNLAIDRKGVAYEAGIYEISTSLRMSSDIVGRVIYLQTNADKPDGSEGERNYCAIKVVRN